MLLKNIAPILYRIQKRDLIRHWKKF